MENRARTNFPSCLAAEGAPFYEQRQARSAGERVCAALRMARAELVHYIQFSRLTRSEENRARTNFTLDTATEGAPFYEQR